MKGGFLVVVLVLGVCVMLSCVVLCGVLWCRFCLGWVGFSRLSLRGGRIGRSCADVFQSR